MNFILQCWPMTNWQRDLIQGCFSLRLVSLQKLIHPILCVENIRLVLVLKWTQTASTGIWNQFAYFLFRVYIHYIKSAHGRVHAHTHTHTHTYMYLWVRVCARGLLNSISTPYGLFNVKIWIICKCLIVILTIFLILHCIFLILHFNLFIMICLHRVIWWYQVFLFAQFQVFLSNINILYRIIRFKVNILMNNNHLFAYSYMVSSFSMTHQ